MDKFARLLDAIELRLRPKTALARRIVKRADAARDARRLQVAASLYEEAISLAPGRAGVHIQRGHMLKELGDFVGAEDHYAEAQRLRPKSADLAMQMGHFYKVAGRPDQAAIAYGRAVELRPGWAEAIGELAAFRSFSPTEADAAPVSYDLDMLAPELVPDHDLTPAGAMVQAIHVRRLGAHRERSRWGVMKVLRGLESIRGFCVSDTTISEIAVLLNGEVIHAVTPQLGEAPDGSTKYVFNIWFDFSAFPHGPHEIRLRARDVIGRQKSWRTNVLIKAPLPSPARQDSDAFVPFDPADPRSIEKQVADLPSMVRSAVRTTLPAPQAILVQRVDQLGDLVCSVPAIQRLRELIGPARMVGLVSHANHAFAKTIGLFDDVIAINFPEHERIGRRFLPLHEQEDLRRTLKHYDFDIAIDLCEGAASRPLLALSGAPFTFGFKEREMPWLSGGLDCNVHDPINHLEIMSQSQKVLSLVEGLGTLLHSRAEVRRRGTLDPTILAAHDLAVDERFIVLHAGARLRYSRWPHFQELAQLLLARTSLTLVLLADEPTFQAACFGEHANRVRIIEGKLSFDMFDALLSYCAAFVGNDSGPKHLASLRGVPVISLHAARLNWREWGQEISGSIISRRVPCAGCAIGSDDSECGRDFACIRDITAEEVFGVVREHLIPGDPVQDLRQDTPRTTN